MHEETSGTSSKDVSQPSVVRWFVAAQIVLFVMALCGVLLSFRLDSGLTLALAGVIAAQIALLLIWIALILPLSVWREKSVGVLVMIVGMAALVAGPIVILALPLALGRIGGLRVQRFQPDGLPPPWPLQYSVRRLLLVTLLIAMLFAFSHFLRVGATANSSHLGLVGNVLGVIGSFVVGLASMAIVLTVPLVCVWVILSPGTMLPRIALAGIGSFLVGFLAIHSAGGMSPDIVAAMAVAGLSVATLMASLAALRGLGYRLVCGEEPASPFAAQRD